MAIVKMNKFTLLSFESQKEKLIENLQGFSQVQFINLQDENFIEENKDFQSLEKENSDSNLAKCEENLSKAKSTLDFMEAYLPKKSGLQSLKEEKETLTLNELESKVKDSSWENSYKIVKEKEEKLLNLETKKSSLKEEIDVLNPWKELNASFKDLQDLKKVSVFLGTIPKQYEEIFLGLENEFKLTTTEVISSNNQEVYIFSISHENERDAFLEKLKECGFSAFNTSYEGKAKEILEDFEKEIIFLNEGINKIREELTLLSKEENELKMAYEYYGNLKERLIVSKNFLKTKRTVVMQGWIPVDKNEKFNKIIKKSIGDDFFLTFEEIREEEYDKVPVKLKNGKIARAFESVTNMYSVPKYGDIDPTPVMMPFYLLFFGMMIADVGYGLVMLIAALIAMKLLKNNEKSTEFAKFFAYLSIPSILFGFVYGAFFNDAIKLPVFISTTKDVTTILIMSVGFGVLQIFVGLGIKAYVMIKKGDILGAFFDVGAWYMILIGLGVMLGGGMIGLPSIAKTIATVVVIAAAVIIILTGGRAEKSVGAKLGQGAYSLYNITGYIGDLVSYTRLMAIGLAGGSIAGALNLLIGMLPGGFIGIIVGAIAFILAHTFNLLLSLLSAYVHTARLQYVEYFSKFYDGGGKAFAPFRTLNKYVNLKEN
ncbi:MAG: V-type ATP synthase subunit I [Clostridium perfringens]|nr:V-type ATP synthase subunit I [Clostridium perfringens]